MMASFLLPVRTCCAPTKARAAALDRSEQVSAGRVRVTSGSPEGMVLVPGGEFLMGSEDSDAVSADGEGPVRRVQLDPFLLDCATITNVQFREFIHESGYRTEAESFGWSFVFHKHLPDNGEGFEHPPLLRWWRQVHGARWCEPEGPGSSLSGRDHYPAVHISWNDAAAYAQWAGKRLPTEAEWEFAARGGLEGRRFPWGDELTPNGVHRCNIWQGTFPDIDTAEDGYSGVAPVDAYPPNAFGLRSMTGNTWEWCADWFSTDHHLLATRSNPVGPEEGVAKVMRGGSYLCHASYCNRYRVAARTSNTPDSSSSNIGFRCALDVPAGG